MVETKTIKPKFVSLTLIIAEILAFGHCSFGHGITILNGHFIKKRSFDSFIFHKQLNLCVMCVQMFKL